LKADMATAVVATLCGRRTRLVASKHNDEQVLLRAPVSMVHGVLGNLPARTIVLSDHVGKFVEEHGRVKRSRLRRIYYGLDPAPFEVAASARPTSSSSASRDSRRRRRTTSCSEASRARSRTRRTRGSCSSATIRSAMDGARPRRSRANSTSTARRCSPASGATYPR
jgi:hypothetical protein